MGEFFKWEYVVTLFPKVLSALPTTLLIVLFATLIGSFLGFILAYFRIERIPILHQLSAIYVSFIRGTPILVQMFIVFYGHADIRKGDSPCLRNKRSSINLPFRQSNRGGRFILRCWDTR